MANILGFVALGVCGGALFFNLLALALPYWQGLEILGASGHMGLFRACASICETCDTNCGDVLDSGLTGSEKSSYQATQAMVLMGFFALVGALVVFVLLLFVMKGRKMLGYIAAGLAIAGGFFLMVGMGIYADKLKVSLTDYGAGFAFDILGWLAAWAAGGIMIFMTFTGKADQSQ